MANSTDNEQRKVLFTATIDGHIMGFHLPYLKWFQERGYETWVAARGDTDIPYCDNKINIDIRRSPFRAENIRAYRQLAALLKQNHFDLIHCHTPMGSVLTRLAAKKYRKKGTAVLYTAHGFHFYKGGPPAGWLLYYPIEKALSRCVDGLITINTEDYETAKNKFHAKRTFLSLGVGYDDKRFFEHTPEDKSRYRAEYGYAEDDILLIYVAELNRNKNQRFLIDVLKKIREKHSNVRLLLVGKDSLDGAYQAYAKEVGVAEYVDFLGLRRDVDKLIPMCDIAVASSLREGLPVNVMEVMACGLPVVATDIRGHKDLITNGENGFLALHTDIDAFAANVENLISNRDIYDRIIENGYKTAARYTQLEALNVMKDIYVNYAAL